MTGEPIDSSITDLLKTMSLSDSVEPSTLQVDYDKNITPLYESITKSDWAEAIKACKANPDEAKTWVVRHYQDDDNDEQDGSNKGHDDDDDEPEIMWRFLPIHSACARKPPAEVIEALLAAYPDAAKCIDDQGMYALHYACGNQASRDVIRILLNSYPKAAKLQDPRGMLPIHYLACWGPSSVSVIDMVLVANRDVANARDDEGSTPLDLALEGDYEEQPAVVQALRRWLDASKSDASTAASSTMQASSPVIPNKSIDPEEKKLDTEDVDAPHIIHIATPKADSGIDPTEEEQASTHMVGMLKQEVSRLRDDIQSKESDMMHHIEAKEKELSEQKSSFEAKVKAVEKERDDSNRKCDELQSKLDEKDSEIEALKEALKKSQNERDGLRQTLADVTEQHEKSQKKSEMMYDRFGSLNACLTSMMDQQNVVLDAMKAREEHWDKVSELRRLKMQELLEIESTKQDLSNGPSLKACLQKQTREMEAIVAVIAAARE